VGNSKERECRECNVWLCINCMPICPTCDIPVLLEHPSNESNFITDPKEDVMSIEYEYDDPCECFQEP